MMPDTYITNLNNYMCVGDKIDRIAQRLSHQLPHPIPTCSE